ncbi:MAG: RICIN domain-containing protein [Halieaceae bacterium]|jgi:hypothetical protein|nr:RICIN domain-containing protein [Halieaceae bacterium]
MKYAYISAALLAAYLPNASAVDLNTDALKTMQQEGHKIVEASKNWRSFTLHNGQCLQVGGAPDKVGANLVIRDCNPKANSQKWQFDDKGRLASFGGTCVGVAGDANALMQACSGEKSQQWKHDGKQRLVNGLKQCLQAAGKADAPSGNVVTATCSGSPNQVWK